MTSRFTHQVRLFGISALGLFLGAFPYPVKAEETPQEVSGNASIEFEGMEDPHIGILDPETLKEVHPTEVAQTQGALRIDFAPQLTFAQTKITKKNLQVSAYGQQFLDQKETRGNFIQVSDYRGSATGWTLMVRQDHPFRHETDSAAQLTGAVLSFDKAWVNSKQDRDFSPKVSKEIIQMNNIGESYVLASADRQQGMGTWSIAFGASQTMSSLQEGTLTPVLDEQGNPVLDSKTQQAVQINRAVTLNIPASQSLKAGTYNTVLTWTIAELP